MTSAGAPPSEFELIRRYFAPLSAPASDVVLGIGDDCALLAPLLGRQIAITSDTLIAGRHFPVDTAPADIGWKALAVNLSDLAAMGAEARWFTLALSLPSADEAWLAGFAEGLAELANAAGVSLVGGDTTRSETLSITITALGLVPPAGALLRSGAKVGDRVCVSGTLGDAALGLQRLLSPLPLVGEGGPKDRERAALNEKVVGLERPPSPPAGFAPLASLSPPVGEGSQSSERYLISRLNRPTPRLELGLALRDLAHAAIDLSDGLASDLGHILAASGVGARIDASALPASTAFNRLAPQADRLALQATGGDDYELCLCIAPDRLDAARAAARQLGIPLTDVGRVTAERGLVFTDAADNPLTFTGTGYRHFP